MLKIDICKDFGKTFAEMLFKEALDGHVGLGIDAGRMAASNLGISLKMPKKRKTEDLYMNAAKEAANKRWHEMLAEYNEAMDATSEKWWREKEIS